MQKKYVLQDKFRRPDGTAIREISYVADYWIKYKDNTEKIVDVKGAGTLIDPSARIKKKMFYFRYPNLDFDWWTWSSSTGWMIWDKYIKLKKAKKKKMG